MQQRQLGPFSVSAIGLGCMNLCHAYGPPVPEAQAQRLLLAALDAGVTHFDTAALYGFGASEALIGKFLSAHRSRFTLASKCGMTGVPNADGVKVRVIDGRPATLKATCEEALRRLQTDVIDLYYLHRWDKRVPIEDSVGALADLVREGKIRSTAISGLRVQSEYSVCSAAMGCTACARRSVPADTSDRPMLRILPSRTRSASAPTLSSMGTRLSQRCR